MPPEDYGVSSIPISPHLGALGRRWALRIIADIGFRNRRRFSQLLRSNPGMTPRVLSRRLKELEQDGVIARCGPKAKGPARWKLTVKGSDALPTIMNLIAYGARWNANYRFLGKAPVVADMSQHAHAGVRPPGTD